MAVLRIRLLPVCFLVILVVVVVHVVHVDVLGSQRELHRGSLRDDTGFLLLSGDQDSLSKDVAKGHNRADTPPCAIGARVERMQEWCRFRKKPAKLTLITWRNLYVDHHHKLLFCEVPKAGASTLKKIFIQASPLFPPNSSVPSNVHKALDKFNITHPKLNLEALEPLLEEYFKVIVVRHPLTRLLSAYKEKFYDSTFLPKVSHHVIKTYRAKYKNEALDQEHPERPSWREFTDFVATEHRNNSERHWKTILELCSPCLIGYDAILKLETLEKDFDVVLGHISRDKIKISHENVSVGRKGKTAQSYFDELEPAVIEKLRNVYRHDLNLFGYEFNDSAIPDCYEDNCTC